MKTIYETTINGVSVYVALTSSGNVSLNFTIDGRRTRDLPGIVAEAEQRGVMIEVTPELRDMVLKCSPTLHYALDRSGGFISVGELCIMHRCSTHPEMEAFLNNPHHKSMATLMHMLYTTSDNPMNYALQKDRFKKALSNWHKKDVPASKNVPLSMMHIPAYRWLSENYHSDDESVWDMLTRISFCDKDVNYLMKSYPDGLEEGIDEWVHYMDSLYTCVREHLIGPAHMDDPYWRRPSRASFYDKRARLEGMLQELMEMREEHMRNNPRHGDFDEKVARYSDYRIDIQVGAYRFYTSMDRETWISHSNALKQCCYNARYYAAEDTVLVFVEKDGAPYGTIEYNTNSHTIPQARVDQTDYHKSKMPNNVIELFRSSVMPEMQGK